MTQDERQHNPWKTLSSTVTYRNPWITVREDQVIRPDGTPGIYGVVEARIATGVVAMTADQEVYLVGQYRYPTQHYSWEIIEGGNDPGELPLEAAKRELVEEAGLLAQDWQQLGEDVHLSNCFSSEVGLLYLRRGLQQTEQCPEATEVLSLKVVPFAQCWEMVVGGEIKDAMTIIGLTRAKHLLKL